MILIFEKKNQKLSNMFFRLVSLKNNPVRGNKFIHIYKSKSTFNFRIMTVTNNIP